MKIVPVQTGVLIDGEFFPDSPQEKRDYARERAELDRFNERCDLSLSRRDEDVD